MIDEKNQNENLHALRRKRVKAKFLNHGLEAFDKHEMLELLLYYALPRQDTNILGHKLINTFGSISRVFDADIASLCEIDGISEHTALLIKLVPELAKVYVSDKNISTTRFDSFESVGRYFTSSFLGLQREEIHAVFLDDADCLLDCLSMKCGTANISFLDMRKLAKTALDCGATKLVMAHNHPRGTAIPSPADLEATKKCFYFFSVMDILLVEHYVVSGDKFLGIIATNNEIKKINRNG